MQRLLNRALRTQCCTPKAGGSYAEDSKLRKQTLDKRPRRTNEPDPERSNSQAVLLFTPQPVARTPRPFRQRLQLRQATENSEGAHASRVDRQMLDRRAKRVQRRPKPPRRGTKHLANLAVGSLHVCELGVRHGILSPLKRQPKLENYGSIFAKQVRWLNTKNQVKRPGILPGVFCCIGIDRLLIPNIPFETDTDGTRCTDGRVVPTKICAALNLVEPRIVTNTGFVEFV